MKRFLIAPVLLAGLACAADDAADRVPPELRICISIQRSSERLACYDRVIAAMQSGKPAGETGASAESSFGLLASESAPPPAEDKAVRGDLQSLKANVKGFSRGADGSRVIHLDNGQSWVQLSGGDTLLRAGDPVTINRAALGSFQMLVPSGRSAKVKRISWAAN